MPVRKLLAGRVTRWPPDWPRNSGSALGRRHDGDGAVTVQVVMSNRTEGDTRAVAVSFVRVSIDPTLVTTDLRDARAAIKPGAEDSAGNAR